MDFKVIMPEHFSLHCCTCLNKYTGAKHDLISLTPPLLQIFEICTEYKEPLKGLYPDGVCQQCFDKLEAFDEFQAMSKKSKQFFEQMVNTFNIKSTTEDESDEKTDELSLVPLKSSTNIDVKEDPLQMINMKDEIEDLDQYLDCSTEQINDRASSTIESISNELEIHAESVQENTCKFCGKKLASIWGLRLHLNTHKNKRPFQCDQCDQGFNAKVRLQEHIKKVHSVSNESIEERTCKICGRILSSIWYLNSHMQTHQEQRPFQCDICKRGFNLKARLQLHMNEVHGDQPIEISCKYGCEKTFDRLHKAQVHYRKSHGNAEKVANEGILSIIEKDEFGQNHTCKICGKTLCSTSSLNMHMHIHSEKRPFQCQQCDKGFNAKVRLQVHVRKAHTENPVEIHCKFACGETFDCSKKANRHYSQNHGEVNISIPKAKQTNIYVCEDCGKTFHNREYLKTHRAFHLPLEQRSYVCEKCNKRFASSGCLKMHMMRHNGVKKHQCPHCGVKKTTNREIRLHISNVHTKDMQAKCEYCSKMLLNPSSLRRHIRVVHQGIKAFKCSYCDKSFGKGETLKYHERTHTGERPHKCVRCDRSFAQPTALRIHMKTHERC